MIRFRRTPFGVSLQQWEDLKCLCNLLLLTDGKDKLFWKLDARGRFSVGSPYRTLKRAQVPYPYKFLWNTKVPLKIKFFLWLVSRGSILTRDVLKARLGKDNGTCLFCARQESIDHLLFSCSLARYIWRVFSAVWVFKLFLALFRICLITGCCGIVVRKGDRC